MGKYTIELNHDELLCILSSLKSESDKKHSKNESAIAELRLANKITDIINNTKVFKLEDMENKRLLKTIEKLNDKVYDLECELKDLEDDRTVKIADFFTDYSNIQNRYDYNNVDYQMNYVEDITRVFGITMQKVKGFDTLTEEDQVTFSRGILDYLNSWGLGNRVQHLPVGVRKEGKEFRFSTLCGRYEQHMDSKGNIL